jgi:uncharacterized repeat protein (TIGR01451 family)
MVMPAASPSPRLPHLSTRWSSRPLRALAVLLATALTALVAGAAAPLAVAADGDAFTITVGEGSPAVVTGTGSTPLVAVDGEPGSFDLPVAQNDEIVRFSFVANCVLEDEACVDATARLDLTDLRLASTLTPPAATPGGVGYTVGYLDADGAPVEDPAADLAAVATVVLAFVSYDAGGQPGPLAGGNVLDFAIDATVVPPPGGGQQTGGLTTTPSVGGADQTATRLDVRTTFVPVLSTSTDKSWEPGAPFLSGSADTARTAVVAFTNTGDTASGLVVDEPADPAAAPSGGDAFNLLQMTAVRLDAWPAGADSVTITTWQDGAVALATTAADLAAAQAWLSALPADALAATTGLRLAFAGAIEPGGSGSLAVDTVQLPSGNDTAGRVTGRNGSVEFEQDGAAPSGAGSSDFHTVAVTNTAATTATSEVPDAADATSQGSADLRIWDPYPYAGSTKSFVAPGTATPVDEVYPGGFAVARLTGTNWTRQAADSLVLLDQPDPAGDPALAAALTAGGGVDPDMFAPTGLVFAGFGSGVVAGTGDGQGLVWPDGATEVTVRLRAGGEEATWTAPAGSALPAAIADFGFAGAPAWSDVTALEVTFTGAVAMGATATVPYVVTTGPDAEVQGTTANVVLARSTVDGLTSDPTPRTAQSGNRPLSRDSLLVSEPYAAATVTKTIPESFVEVPGGSVTTVLRATAGTGTDTPTTLVLEDSARAPMSATAWWQRFAPTDVTVTAEADVTATVEYYDSLTDGEPAWTTAPAAPWTAGTSRGWLGVRVVATKDGGARFDAGEVVQAVVPFTVAVDAGQSFPDGRTVTNCAVAQAVLDYGGTTPSSRETAPACDQVVGYTTTGSGPAALVKDLDTDVVEGSTGSAGSRTATLTWGTAGRDDLTSATVSDENTAGDGTVRTGRTGSFWDTFDLAALRPISSGPAAETGRAYDPYLAFDQVSDVEVYDVVEGRWVSLATSQWAAGAWVPAGAGRTDVRFGAQSHAQFPYAGSFPGVTVVDGTLRERTGAVRVVVTALTPAQRAQVVSALEAAGDWRVPALSAGLVDGAVAGTEGPARQVQLDVRLRTTSRADASLVVNDAATYNAGDPSLVVNDARVTATGGASPFDAVGASNGAGHRTVTLLPTTVTAAATKSWTRASENPEDITGDPEHVHTIPLQQDPDGDPASATLALTAGNDSGIPVDSLVLTEPQGIEALEGQELDGDAPFAWFAVSDVTVLTAAGQLAGATGVAVTAYALDAGGRVAGYPLSVTDAGAPGLADDLGAALAAEGLTLADLVGLRVHYSGRVAPEAEAGLRVVTTLRAANLVTGQTPADRLDELPADETFRVTNTAHVAVADQLVCAGTPESYGADGSCTPAPDTTTATDHVIIQAPQVQAFASKRFDSAATLTRDAGSPVVAVLDVQNFGNSEADSVSLTDADPTFFNAVALSEIRLLSVPTGAETATLEVLARSDALTVDTDGAYTAPVDGAWTSVGVLTRDDLAGGTTTWTPSGVAWPDVIGVRVVFTDIDDDRIATPGAALGTVRLTGALRTHLLSGGLPAATGADPAWEEAARNPGEAADATVANTVVAQAERDGSTGTEDAATAAFRVQAGTQQVGLTKTSPNPPAGGWTPGSVVPYTITLTNTGTADVVGPVITDRLPADDTLAWTGGHTVGSTDPDLGSPVGGAPVLDEATGAVVVTWPATARLAPGRSITVTLDLRIAEAPSTLTIVNAAAVTATGRQLLAAPTGNGGAATCRPGSSFEGSGAEACVTSAPALSMNASNVFLSEKWVSTGSADATSTTDATCAPRGPGADATWFRYPCVAPVAPGGTIDWQVQVRSMADAATPTVTMVDLLPRPGDYQAMKASGRGSQWRPVWDGVLPAVVPVTGVAGATSRADGVAHYYVTTADYAAGGLPASTSYDPLPADAWTEVSAAMSPQDAARVTGFKVVLDYSAAGNFTKNSAVRLQWSMRAPVTGAADDAVAWNSYAFRVEPEGRAPLASVPLKAGVRYAVPGTLFAVGDRVWLDADRDGVQDAGEGPVPGVTVTLLAADGTELGSTTTAADGSYLFQRLAAGDYRVAFTLPAELAARYRFTGALVGGDPASDSDATPATGDVTVGRSAVFTLDVGAPGTTPVDDPAVDADHLNPTLDAGLVDAPLAVGDHVWLDADHDGQQDPGEQPLGGVVVRLLDADGIPLATTTSDADGWYAFGGLGAGDYLIEFVRPDGYRFSRPLQGSDPAVDSDADRSTGRSAVIHLAHGEPSVRATTDAERAALRVAGTDAGSIDPTVDAGLFLQSVVGPVTDLALRKDAVVTPADGGDPAVAEGGDTVTYTVTATNRGTVAAEDVVLTDDVPAQLAVRSVDAGTGTPAWTACTVTGQDPRGYGGTVRCELGDDLPAGQAALAVTVVTTVDPDVATDTVTNTASVTATNEDPTTTLDNTDDASVPVAWLAVTAQPRCVADAPWLDYAIAAHNVDAGSTPITLTWYPDADGDRVADGPAVATRTLPAGSDLTGSVLWPGAAVDDQGRGIAWPGSRAVLPGETPDWENQVLDPTLPEHALRQGALVEVHLNPTTSVTVAYPDATPACAVERLATLRLTKTVDADRAAAGDRVDFALQVDATGLGATDTVELTDTLPRTLRVVDVVPGAPVAAGDPRWAGCAVTDRDGNGNGGTVSCVLDGWIGQGQSAPAVTVVAAVAAGATGTITNRASVRWSEPGSSEVLSASDEAAASLEVQDVAAQDGGAGEPLAVTGLEAAGLVLAAVLLVGAGVFAVVVRRRGVPVG